MEGRTNSTTLVTVASTIPMVLLSKRNGGTGSAQRNGHANKNHSNTRDREGAKYAQIICKEVKKAFQMQSHKCKKRHAKDSDIGSNSDYSS